MNDIQGEGHFKILLLTAQRVINFNNNDYYSEDTVGFTSFVIVFGNLGVCASDS